MADHVNTYSDEDKQKWLKQRGWTPVQRQPDQPTMWRDPDRGVSYHFAMAMKKALEDCRLPADFELRPE
jgi:hypothetical protein